MAKDLYGFPVIYYGDRDFIDMRLPDFPQVSEFLCNGEERIEEVLGRHLYWLEKTGAENPRAYGYRGPGAGFK